MTEIWVYFTVYVFFIALAWHPIHEKLFVSGGLDGSLFFWLCGSDKELAAMEDAHENIIWDVSWHPLGHMLVSGSNDTQHVRYFYLFFYTKISIFTLYSRFWTRNRPGDTVIDKTDEISAPKTERSTGIILKMLKCQILINNEMMGRSFCFSRSGLPLRIWFPMS